MPLNGCTQWGLARKNAGGASLCNLVKRLHINVTLILLLSLNSVNLVQGETTVGKGESKEGKTDGEEKEGGIRVDTVGEINTACLPRVNR